MMEIFKRYSGIMAIITVVAPMVYIFSLLPEGYELSSLSYVVEYDNVQPIFTISLLVAATLMYVFFSQYVNRNFKTDPLFKKFYMVAIVCQFIVALVPVNAELTVFFILHWAAALILGISIIGVMIVFAKNQANKLPVEIQSKTIILVSLFVLAANTYAVLFLDSHAITQALGAIVFLYWISRVTFLNSTYG